jgi:hypothetical protein
MNTMQVCLTMEEFRDNVDKHEAVAVPEDPVDPPEEWARQQVRLYC